MLVLCAILGFSLWNGYAISRSVTRWTIPLTEAGAAAAKEDWDAAEAAMQESYQDWQQYQTWLHVAFQHSQAENIEDLYRRTFAFLQFREEAEFQSELAGLRNQLRQLAESERISLGNIM